MSQYQFNLPVRPKQLEAIGMVAVEWAYLESVIQAAIWSLASLSEDYGEAITTHLPMPARLDMLMTLFRIHHKEEDAKTLAKMCDNIRRKLSPLRGDAVHTKWTEGDMGSPMIYRVRARGRLEREKKGRPAPEIRAVAAQIADQTEELRKFLEKRQLVVATP